MALPSIDKFKKTGGSSALPPIDDFVTTKKKASESNQEYANFVKFASSMSDDAVAHIATRFRNDWDYDEADGEDIDRKSSGKIPKALENSYTSSATDKWLQSRGLPSSKKLEKYIEDYNTHVAKLDTADSARNAIYSKWDEIHKGKGELTESDAAAAYWEVANSADYADYLDYFKSEHDTFDKTVSDYDTESEFLEAQSKFDTKDTEYDLFFRDEFNKANEFYNAEQIAAEKAAAAAEAKTVSGVEILDSIYNNDATVETRMGSLNDSLARAFGDNRAVLSPGKVETALKVKGYSDDEIAAVFERAGRMEDYVIAQTNKLASSEVQERERRTKEKEYDSVLDSLALNDSVPEEATAVVKEAFRNVSYTAKRVSDDLVGLERAEAMFGHMGVAPAAQSAVDTLIQSGYSASQIAQAFDDAGKLDYLQQAMIDGKNAFEVASMEKAVQLMEATGCSELEAYNTISRSGLRVDEEVHSMASYKHQLMESGLDAETAQTLCDELDAETRQKQINNYVFDPNIQMSAGDQLGLTIVSVPFRAALSIASNAVNLADMVFNQGSSESWEAADWLNEQAAKWTEFGRSSNTPILNIAGDIASEVLRMYATASVGGALSTAVGGSSVAATGMGKLLTKAAGMAPFIGSSMGSYYGEALAGGATKGQATWYGIIGGTFEGFLESLGASEMFGKVFSKATINGFVKNGKSFLHSKAGQKVAGLIVSAIGEGAEEGASYVGSWLAGGITGQGWDFSGEELWDNAKMGFLIGMFGSAAVDADVAGEIFNDVTADWERTGTIVTEKVDKMVSSVKAAMMPKQKRLTTPRQKVSPQDYGKAATEVEKAGNTKVNAEKSNKERHAALDSKLTASNENLKRKGDKVNAVLETNDAKSIVGVRSDYEAAKSANKKLAEEVKSAKAGADKEYESIVANADASIRNNQAIMDGHDLAVDDENRIELEAKRLAAVEMELMAQAEQAMAQEGDDFVRISQSVGANFGTMNPEVSEFRSNTLDSFFSDVELAMENFAPEEFNYDKNTEVESQEEAKNRIKLLGVEKSIEVLSEKGQWNGVDMDTAFGVLRILRDEARLANDQRLYWDVANWAKEMQKRTSSSAQMLQATAKYSRTPEGMIIEAQKNVDKAEQKEAEKHPKTVAKVNKETEAVVDALNNGATPEEAASKVTGKKGKENTAQQLYDLAQSGNVNKDAVRDLVKAAHKLPVLTESDINAIYELVEISQTAETDRERQEAAYRAGLLISSKQGEGTLLEKVRAFSYMSMLLNVKTGMKNFAGNLPMFVMETFKDVIATPVDILVSKKTGERTTTIASAERFTSIPSAAAKGFKDSLLDVKHDVNTSFLPGRIEYNARGGIFKREGWNRLERFVGQYMGIGDRMWAQIAYNGRLAELKTLGKDITSEAAMQDAEMYALDRVFQNNSALAQRALKVRKSLGVFGDIVLPFARTPANIADKLLDYSPVGLVKAVAQWGRTAKTEQFDQKLFVDRVGRGLTGTGMLILGGVLAAKGILVGGPDDSEEREAMKNAGVSGYALKFGDTYHTIEWASPVGTMLLMGGVLSKLFDKDTLANQASVSEVVVNGVQQGINAFFSNSFLSGVADLIGESDSVGEAVTDSAINSTSRFTPSLLSALARIFDKYERDTYDTDPLVAQGKYLLSRIPGLRNLLPEKIATDGTYMENTTGDTIVGRAVENLIDPGNTTRLTDDPVHREIYRLTSEGFDGQTLPTAEYSLSWTVNKVKTTHKLTEEERREYQQMLGEATYAAAQTVINDPSYANWDDETRSEKLKKAVDDAASSARKQYRNILKEKGGN